VGTERDRALDGVRALAALSVLVFHVWLYRDNRVRGELGSTLDQVLRQGSVGLIAFFVLSGFLLYRGFARAAVTGAAPPALGAYAARRAARILPAYYACCAGCVLLYVSVGPTDILPSAGELPLFAIFAQNYSQGTLMELNPVLWTLPIEMAFYAALPLLALVGLRLGRRRIGTHALFLVALVGVTVAWKWLDYANAWGEIPGKTLVAYIGHFALGMLVALWLERRRAGGRAFIGAPTTTALMLVGLAIVVLQGFWRYRAPGTLPLALFSTLAPAAGFALIVAAAAAGRGRATAWLRWRPLAAVGVISYGLYLWHLPLLLVLANAGALPEPLVPRLLIVLGVALLAAAASWRFVERPAIDRLVPARHRAPELLPRPHAAIDHVDHALGAVALQQARAQ